QLLARELMQSPVAAHDIRLLGELAVECCDVATTQLNVAETLPLEQCAARLKHRLGQVEPDDPRIRTTAGQLHQQTTGTAPEIDHSPSFWKQPADRQRVEMMDADLHPCARLI